MTNKIAQYMERGRELICSLLFPRRCPVCDEILEPEEVKNGIHSACKNKLYPVIGAVCMHCGRPFGDNTQRNTNEYCVDCMEKKYHIYSAVQQAKSLFVYRGHIKSVMYRFKYSNKREYAIFFAEQAVQRYGWWLKQKQIDLIVPVPMYRRKQKKRGYNQAESFAAELSNRTGIPMRTDLVFRIKDTIPQKGLNQKERKINVEKAFQMRGNVVQYSCAMVVDDIYTTGNTAEAVAQQLIKQGIRQVYLMTVCIGGDM